MININNITYFDTETTGIKYNQDRLVSVFCENKKRGWYLNTLTNPEIEIPEGATNVHRITNEMVADKPLNKEVLNAIVNIFNDTCVISGYNILRFDVPLILNLCRENNIPINYKNYQYIDVYLLLKIAVDEEDLAKMGSLKLSSVYKYVTGKELKNAHDAKADVKATKVILKWLLNNYEVEDCLMLNHEYILGEPVSENYKFYTGKYPEKTVKDLLLTDKSYLSFLKSRNLLTFEQSINDLL